MVFVVGFNVIVDVNGKFFVDVIFLNFKKGD